MADVLANGPLNIEFRRTLNGSKWSDWLHFVEELMGVTLSNEPDQFRWRLTPSGMFSVKSMYADLMNGQVPFRHKYIWKLRVPLKIRIFMWFLQKKVILTKDNLIRRRWTRSKQCVFYHSDETVEHLFISCPFARNIWRLIHFTFNISPPTNITNMFGNWLAGVDKQTKARIRILACVLLFGQFGTAVMILFLTR